MIRFFFYSLCCTVSLNAAAQNVGIGVASPLQKLHVDGTIRSNQLVTATGTNTLLQTNVTGDIITGPRYLYGLVEDDGTVLGGSAGYTITKGTAGLYTLNYNTPFTAVPAVSITPVLTVTGGSGSCANSPLAGCFADYLTGCGFGDEVSSFSTTGGTTNISNIGSGCSFASYGDYTATDIVTVPVAGSFNFSVQSGPVWPQGFGIWIDVNQDGSFSAAENFYLSPAASTTAFAGSINTTGIPCGTYVMRVRSSYASVPQDTEGCGTMGSSSFGETEDYTLVVDGGPTTTRILANLFNATATSADVQLTLPNGTTLTDAPFHFQVLGQ